MAWFACLLLGFRLMTTDLPVAYAACPSFPYTVPAADTADLINAITCAVATSDDDVINLTNSTYTLTAVSFGVTGLPTIPSAATAGKLRINGNGAIITRSVAGGTPNMRFFFVSAGGDLALNTITLTGGQLVGALAGGAISNTGILRLTNSAINGNSSAGGGAIYNAGGIVLLTNNSLTNNSAILSGGAILNNDGTVIITNSTLSGNSANGGGGEDGGGALDSYSGESSVVIVNSTLVGNTAVNTSRSGVWMEAGTLTIQNSIIANNNGANNCAVTGGFFTDNGNNIDNGTSCAFGGVVGQNTDPLLGTLANNGGQTLTHTLSASSPAINAGNTAGALDQDGSTLVTDQRGVGFPRVIGGRVDIGAVEATVATVNVQLTLQGRTLPAPHPSRIVTVNVRVQPQAGGAVFYDQTYTTDASSTFSIPNLPTGTHLFTFKGNHTLARQATLTIVTDVNTTTTATLFEGDANGNNLVNISDFSLLATAFGKMTGQQGFNALTDFSNDGLVNILDFSLLASNFNRIGDGGVIP